MTPALLFALEQQRIENLKLESLPVDKLAWMYANSNRDPGEKDADGREIRPPAPAYELELFRTFGGKAKSLAAKDLEVWDCSLLGAKADKAAFEAWSGSKMATKTTVIKEPQHGRI